ncbi:unnamed protein product [Symbiodinium microadriaticum]|nr:unnamed protein product [Symbiodinium microadriaticum]
MADEEYSQLDAKQILAKIESDGQEVYDSSLQEWEKNRREGKRARSSSKRTQVKAETRNSLTTRVLLGYLWPQALLKKHKLEHLWSKGQKQSIMHCNKNVVGILRDTSTLGAIEVYQDSQTSAVRVHQAADCESTEDADTCFRGLSKNLNVAVTSTPGDSEDAEPTLQLKSKKAKFEEDDDWMSVWGISGFVGSGNSKGSRDKDDSDEEKDAAAKPKNKRAKTAPGGKTKPEKSGASGGLPAGLSLSETNATSDNASQAADPAKDLPASSSWLFSGKPKAPKGKSASGSKDLDAAEKILTQHNTLCGLLSSDETFTSVSFKKVNDVAEKLAAKSTEDLMKCYRELSTAGAEMQRALSVMRSLNKANAQVICMSQLVSAMQDTEATAETLEASIQESRDAGMSLPVSLDKMCLARLMMSYAAAAKWDELYATLQG